MRILFLLLPCWMALTDLHPLEVISVSQEGLMPIYKNNDILIQRILFCLNRFPDMFIKSQVSTIFLYQKSQFDGKYSIKLNNRTLHIEVKKGRRSINPDKLNIALTELLLSRLILICNYKVTSNEIKKISSELAKKKAFSLKTRKKLIQLYSCINPNGLKLHYH